MSRQGSSLPVPVTCKQLKNLTVDSNNAIKCGHGEITHCVVIALLVSKEAGDSDSCVSLGIEDATGMLDRLQVYDRVDLVNQLPEFIYVRLTIDINADGNQNIQFYVRDVSPISDYSQLVQHQLASYSYYLRCMLPPTPHDTLKKHLSQQQHQQQQNAPHASGLTSNFTGINFAQANNPQMNTMNNGPMNNNNNMSSGPPTVQVQHFLTSHPDNQDGFTIQDISRRTGLNTNQVQEAITQLLDEGSVFSALDENHFSAV